MRRLLVVGVLVIFMPLFSSFSPGRDGYTAFAGRTLTGSYCQCSTCNSGCICDPGEDLQICAGTHPVSDAPPRSHQDLGTPFLFFTVLSGLIARSLLRLR